MLRSIFLFIKKHETPKKTEAKLLKKCNRLYSDFLYSSTKSHTRSYFSFKQDLRADLIKLKNLHNKEPIQSKRIIILKNIKEKLVFINRNPFGIDENATDFVEKHMPLNNKTEQLLNYVF